ncbi:MAG: TrmH family RNA methyltransferase [Saprospiraceae bacterium]|nr:TrmH family RNA methyltransferase [Saprospiraceae bacterium]
MEPLSKARIKLIQSFQHKKFRQKYDKFIVEGLKITKELLLERLPIVESVYISNPDYQSILENLIDADRVCQVSPQQMHQISQMSTPPGVLTVCALPPDNQLPAHLNGMRIFYLDSIRDPGNLGTILRIVDWFGLDFVILSPDCVDIFNHKVLQASMGSALRVRTCVLGKVELLAFGEGKIYVCDAEGKNIYTTPPPDEGIIVLGNESLGVSGEIAHQVKEVFAIPGDRSLGAESLNVASAAAVVAAWWVR